LVALAAPAEGVDLAADLRAQRRALYRLGPEAYRDLALLAAADAGKARPEALLRLAEDWKIPAFPLRGQDLVEAGVPPGREVGRLLEAVRQWWEASDFTPDRAACLARLAELKGSR
jgi:poly(A) polymerase